MLSFSRWSLLRHLFLLAWLAGSAVAQLAAASKSGQSTGEAQPVEVAPADLTSLNQLLPVGKTALRVTVPTVDEEGRLTSIVIMGSITRLDDENFQLEKVSLTSFEHPDANDPPTTPDKTVITLIQARYHAPSRVLVSDRTVTIRKPTLFLTGDSLHYDSAAGRALIKGNARALITDAPRLETTEDEKKEDDASVDTEGVEDDLTPRETKPVAPAASTTTTPTR